MRKSLFFMFMTCLGILAGHPQGVQADGGVGIEYPVCNLLDTSSVAKQLARGERPNPYSPHLIRGGGIGNKQVVFCIYTKGGVKMSASVALENAEFILDETKAVPMIVPLYKGKPQGEHNWFTYGDQNTRDPDAIIVRLSKRDRELVLNP